MTFQQETNLTKDKIGSIEITFFVPETIDEDNPQTGQINIQIIMSDGSIRTKSYNLLERLEDDATGLTHRANLAAMRDYIKARLIAEVLP